MTITHLPTAPQPTDSTSEFNTKSFAWVAALDNWTDEVNALGTQVDLDAAAAEAAAAASELSASVAAGAAAALNAQAWVSGASYVSGDVVYSTINFQTYRRKTNGAGTTDPSSDSTNWEVISGNVSKSGYETLANKTLESPQINTPIITAAKEIKVSIAASNIDLALANFFGKTVTGATTFTVSNVPVTGIVASFILNLTNGGSATITWWSGTKWAGGTAPTLTAAGRDVLGFYTDDGGTTWTGLVLGKDHK